MGSPELTESYLAKIAGWEAMKRARSLLEAGQVLSSNWTPPVLKGVVQAGGTSYRSGLAFKSESDVENMCGCRDSREWGTICAHSVAVGLHHLKREQGIVTPGNNAVKSAVATTVTANPKAGIPKEGLRLLAESGNGEMMELFVILPPNFALATTKGKVTLYFEAKWSRGRMPLNALPKDISFNCTQQDERIIRTIERLSGGETPAMVILESEQIVELLPQLAGHAGVTLGKSQPVEITTAPWRLSLNAKLELNGEITLALAGSIGTAALIESKSGLWSFHDQKLQPLALPPVCRGCLRAPVRIPRGEIPHFLSRDWPLLETGCELKANFRVEDFICEPQAPRFILNLAGGMAQLQAQLQCAYGQRIMTLGITSANEATWLPDASLVTRYFTRDLSAENSAVGRLLRSGFTGPDAQGRYQLLGQNKVLTFFAREFPRLEKEWQTTLEERLEKSTSENLERIEPRFQVSASGENWFDLQIEYGSNGGEKFSSADIQRLILSGQSHTRLKNGRFAVIDTGAVEELQEVLLDCAPEQHEGRYRIGNAQGGFLDASLKDAGLPPIAAPNAWRERIRAQSGEARTEAPPLGDLENVLRPYQKQGVGWLEFLRKNNFGGILADEMGLGKTLQTLAFLRSVITSKPAEERLPSLIVCPTSLVFNWVAEAAKFTPTLRVLALSGPERNELFAQIEDCDLVITSYALIRRDAERYRGINFDTVVLDEAQHIKNRQSQNAQAVKAISAGHHLVLTGTPLENSVLDLWSIFDFLMPGYLGAVQDFRERYEAPIVRDKDAGARDRLARRLRPFILRRLKRDVAKDLPEKIEQVSYAELTPDQAAVYKEILESSRREVLGTTGEPSQARNRMVVLTALLRLRQVCCDLRLLKLPNTDALKASGKLDLFEELLEEILDGGHRALVFSQFVGMLSLIREKLDKEGIEYCYLDGSTQDRAKVVDRFQSDARVPLFLISLKAGGTGLNLTGADTVIHFDPWWNPAVEDQATGRAHRIGQSRVVTSYKLITKGTVEEKIMALQARKKELFQATVGDDEQLVGALTWDEIQDLLSG